MNNKVSSIFQVLVGSILIIIGMTVNATPLGGFALLPLIGIVPVLFGLYGVQSPMCKLVTKAVNSVRNTTNDSVRAVKTPTATA